MWKQKSPTRYSLSGVQHNIDPWVEMYTEVLFTSKATKSSFLVVFTDIRLVVPPHSGPEMLWGSYGSLPEMSKTVN